MSLKHSYNILAPVYDPIVASATLPMRKKSLARLGDVNGKHILLAGVGTGLDLPHLPDGGKYTGLDISTAMMRYAQKRIPPEQDIDLLHGNVMAMPFDDASFDTVLMHLILAVVPEPQQALREACRVVRPGGQILILDKFIKPGQLAPVRRLINIFLRHIATRTDVVFEDLLTQCPELKLINDSPALASGWFRYIELQKS